MYYILFNQHWNWMYMYMHVCVQNCTPIHPYSPQDHYQFCTEHSSGDSQVHVHVHVLYVHSIHVPVHVHVQCTYSVPDLQTQSCGVLYSVTWSAHPIAWSANLYVKSTVDEHVSNWTWCKDFSCTYTHELQCACTCTVSASLVLGPLVMLCVCVCVCVWCLRSF